MMATYPVPRLNASGHLWYEALPPGTVVTTPDTTRPTSRPDLCVWFLGIEDPGSNMLAGDVWWGA